MNLQNEKTPLVSVVATNYNSSEYVLETLDSIAAQTYKNIELIIVDDCSTDDSVEKIEIWLLNYNSPYQFIRSPTNNGVCATCNKGYRIAKGKYISSIATDDVMLPEKIESQVIFFEKLPNNVGMIYSDAFLIDDKGNSLYGTFIQNWRNFDYVPSGDIFSDLLEGNYIPAMSIMIKSSILDTVGYFDENLVCEDFDMWLRISKNYKIIFQDEINIKYRKRKQSLSSRLKKREWTLNNIKVFAKYNSNELMKQRISSMIATLYFEGYPVKKLIEKYKVSEKGFVYKCIRFNIPPNITKSILAIFNRL